MSLMIDAVNWYVGCDWEKNRRAMTDAIATHLSTACVTALGDLIVMAAVIADLWSPVLPDEEQARLLKLRTGHKAFHALGRRQFLPVAALDRHYAFLKVAADGGERVLVVLNFRPEEESVQVDLSGVDFGGLNDLATGAPVPCAVPWSVTLPPYGYRFFGLTGRKGKV